MAGEEKVRRYRAFIAYSHQDKRWAAWLHRRLEFYRVPHRLVGRTTGAGVIQRRLTPIFRDREELATANDLGGKITQALENSDNLIVVCSPSASRSKWVNEEIRRFRRTGRGSRIFCFVVGGQPPGGDLGDGGEGLFPATLCRQAAGEQELGSESVEPLAADVRPGKDGRGLALMKLIAGLLDVDLDELRRRELQRRYRRLAAVAALALFVMAATSLLALEAVVQRNAAEHRRAQAESLVAFMIGNLSQELRPIGRLDLLDMVGKRVLAYYSSQKLSSLDAGSLERRAKALQLVGQVYFRRGHLNEAVSVLNKAEATTARLLARKPNDPIRIFDHAQNVFWLANVAYSRGDSAQAEAGMRRYEQLAQRLVRIEPDNTKWQAEVGNAYINLGVMLLDEDKDKQAVEILRRAVAIYVSLARRLPDKTDMQFNLAQVQSWLANAEEGLGHFDAAYRQRTDELAIYRALLVKNPDDSKFHRSLATSNQGLALLAIDKGDLDEALGRLRTSRQIMARLVKQDPGNTLWREISGKIYLALGEALYGRGELAEAVKAAGTAEGIARSLLATDSSVIRWKTDILIPDRLLQAKLAARGGRHKEALLLARNVISSLDEIPESKRHSETVWSLRIRARLLEGNQLDALGQEGGIAAWRDAVSVVHEDAGSITTITPVTLTAIADSFQRLGKNSEAHRIITRLDAMGYRAPEFLSLKKRLARARAEQASSRPHRGGSHFNH